MIKIIKILLCLFFIYLFASPYFTSSIVFGQELKATCNAVKVEEAKKWPNVMYCKKPIVNGTDNNYFFFVNKPSGYPDYDLSGNVNGNNYWIESLNPATAETPYPVAEWTPDNQKIMVHRGGAFILHGSDNTLSFTSSDSYANVNGAENCTQLVIQMTLMAAEEYFLASNATTDSTNQLIMIAQGVNVGAASMIPKFYGVQVPANFETQLIQYAQNAGLTEHAAVVPYKNGVPLKIVDLKGDSTRISEWTPTQESIDIASAEWAKVGPGKEYDGLYFLHTHSPMDSLRNYFIEEGIDLHYWTTPSAGDINYWQINSNVFDGQKLPEIILGSTSKTELDEGKVYATVYQINRDIDTTGLKKINGIENGRPYDMVDPRDIELSGAISRLKMEVTPDGKIIVSSNLDQNLADILRWEKLTRLQSKIQDELTETYKDISGGYSGSMGKDEAIGKLQDEDIYFQRLDRIISNSDLSQSDKDFYSTLVNNGRTMIQDTINSNFNTWDSYISDFGSLELTLQLQAIDTISGSSYVGQWNLDNGLTITPEAAAFADSVAMVGVDGVETQWGPVSSYEYNIKVGSLLDEISPQLSDSMYVAKTNYLGLIGGISFSFLLALGPHLQHYGQLQNNYILYHIGQAITIIGLALTISQLTFVGIQIISLVSLGTIGTGLITSFITSVATSFFTGFVIGLAISLTVSLIMFILFPILSPIEHYPCEVDTPWYNDEQTRLREKVVRMGDTIHYVYYGVRYCYDPYYTYYNSYPQYFYNRPDHLTFFVDLFYGDGSLYDIFGNGTIFDLHTSYCTTLDGRCFDCSVNVTKPGPEIPDTKNDFPGSFNAAATWNDMGQLTHPIYPPYPFENPIPILVCPEDKGSDESENKCVDCNPNHTELGFCTGTNTASCTHSAEGDCNKDPCCEYNYVYNRCDTKPRDWCFIFNNSVCSGCGCYMESSGTCEEGCGADSRCDERDTEPTSPKYNGIWCDGNILKNCNNTCQYNETPCSATDTDWGNVLEKGSCEERECRDGACRLKTNTNNPNPANDACSCFAKDPNVLNILRCVKLKESRVDCKSNQDCYWGLTEYYPSGDQCKSINVNCTDYKSDYTCIDGRCTVCHDVSGDNKVDIKDILITAKAFGSNPGDWNWNKNADVNNDGKVDIKDILIVAKDYGKDCE